MALTVAGVSFDGPYLNTDDLKKQSGAYAVVGRVNGGKWTMIDAGESADVQSRITTHDRNPCWETTKRNSGYVEVGVAVYYCDEAERMRVERLVRGEYHMPCGQR